MLGKTGVRCSMMKLEADLERSVVQYVESIGGRALKLAIAGVRGFPDRTLLLPGGRVIFVELKRPKGAHTYFQQQLWQGRLAELECEVHMIDNLDDMKRVIDNG